MGQLIGVVLAGGSGPEEGQGKGSLVLDGMTLAERAARTLRPLCGSVLVSISAGTVSSAPAYSAVEDLAPPGRGPLAGLQTAFAVTGTADLLVLGCTYAAVKTDFLRIVFDAARPEDDLVFPTDLAGRDHPLVGLWKRSAEIVVREALLHRVRKVRALLADLTVRRIGPADLAAFDLAQVLRGADRAIS